MIAEESPLYVAKGSAIRLTCNVNYSPEETTSSYIFWYHNDRLINYDSNDRGVVVRTERRYDANGTGSMISSLLINGASHRDAGNYSCKLQTPALTSSATAPAVTVYILNAGETPAAMQRGDKTRPELAHINNTSNNKRLNSQTDRNLFRGLLAVPVLVWYASKSLHCSIWR